MKFIATCKLGLEALVAAELRRLGADDVHAFDARVYFECNYEIMARTLLGLRCAERVLLVVGEFAATTFDELFEGVRALKWKSFLMPHSNIHVTGKSAKSALFSVSDCQSIAKKAIVEALKQSYNTSIIPESGAEIIVEVGLLKDTATIALDACGAGLSRRGYRTFNVPAPISETLGAAIIKLSRYDGERPFIDPMCGSGTLPIEAALIAENRAPGLGREFSAEAWHFIEPKAFALARARANDEITPKKLLIYGGDIDEHCIELCKKHAKKAGIMVSWGVGDVYNVNDLPLAKLEGGLIACNPPYGERLMDKKSSQTLYRTMMKSFSLLPSWHKSIITAQKDFERTVGVRADKRRKLSNGNIECTLYQYFGALQAQKPAGQGINITLENEEG